MNGISLEQINLRQTELSAELGRIMSEKCALESDSEKTYSIIGKKYFDQFAADEANSEVVAELVRIIDKIALIEAKSIEIEKEISDTEILKLNLLEKLTCYRCKKLNAPDSKFCEECGSRLGEKPVTYCVDCKTLNPEGMKFCGECGSRLIKD